MSDNIDYNELDKAVSAAMNARAAAKAKPVNTAEPKPTMPSAPVKPAAKPVRRGVVMDFAPRHSSTPTQAKTPAPKPVVRPTTPRQDIRPATRPVTKPAPINRLVNRPAVKPVIKSVAKPTVAPAKPVSKPVMRPAPAKPAHPAQANPKTAAKPAETKSIIEKTASALKRREAPNGNNYSLGGRSPFVANTKVEKRPLGNNIPETSASALRSTHNIYSQKSPTRATENTKKHIITQDPKKKSGWLWTLIVLGVIFAGGGLGYLAYLLVFAR